MSVDPHLCFRCQIRWLHELRRLPDFHVRTLSSIPATEATHHGNFEEREVVVCRLSSISEMDVTLLVKFRSIVIDCRHPSGYVGSTSPVTDTSRGSEQDRAAPDELSSCAGWNKIAVATSHGDINRLLIDKPDVGDSAPYLRGLSNRRFLEVLALRTGILFGTKTFLSPVYSIGKAILKWSRHRIKGFSGGSGSKFQQVTMLLTTLIKTFDCCIESEKRLNDGMTPGSGLFPWEIRYSKMFPGQCAAYNRVCRQSCSSLSRSHGLQEDAPFAEAAAALLRVRRNCTHSDMGGVLRTVKRRAPTISGVAVPPKSLYTSSSKLADGFNPSQPNFEIARRILTESSKLRHLASILVHECGCDFVWDDSIKSLLSELAIPAISRSKFRETKDSRIAILAVLPEIQILVSVLLNSIGIDHEVLLRPACSYADLSSSESNVEAIAWAHCQLVLSKFNSSSSNKRPNVSIVVASPISVAGDHGGLGVEQADTVICLDEDWSGRGELVMLALVSRCRFHKELNGNGTFRVFRLVAENTCEEAFLASRSEVSIGEASVSGEGGTWPVNAFGAFVAPGPWTTNGTEKRMKEFWRRSRVPRGGSFLFPGSNLFCKREEDIAKILCSKIPLKQLMPSSDKFFFPLLEGEDVIETEMIMLRHLMKGEESASTYRCQESLLLASPVLFVPILPPLLIEFPRAIVERFNLPFYLSRRFVTTVSEIATIQEFRDDTGSILSRTSDPGVNLGRLPMNVTADLVDRELCPFSTKSPTELAASALFYTQAINEKESSNVRNASMSTITVRRVNLYASMFSNSSQLGSLPHDGNQGSEALVYFPPIFPRLQECSSLAKHDVESLESRLHLGDRHAGDSRAEANRNDESTVALVGHNPLGLNVLRFITDDESSYSDAASVLMDLSDDYGVAGIGAVPLERDSALASANCFHEPGNAANVASNAQNEWIASTPLCDMEEFQAALQLDQAGTNANSMIVIVSRKRARGSTGQPRPSQFSRGFGIEAWKGVSAVSASAHSDLNGSGRKGKRPLSASAFNRIPSIDTAQPPPPVGQHFPQRSKDDYRHRLLSTLRQSGIGATIFEAPIFRVASVRVRNKVSDRIIRHSWTSGVALDTGPGLPLLVCKQQASSTAGSCGMFEVNPNTWTSIVKRLKSKEATTGMEAIDFSFAQRSALQDSLVSPCRVDFGPFLCGFLSSPSGMTAVALPKPRVGVTLPMGVKITQAAKDQDSVTWNGDDDNKLKSTVVRFGMNWVLAAKILSGFQDVAIRNSLLPRSARSCRDRWQRLTRSDPSLVIKERTSELVLLDTDQVPPEGDLGRRWEMTHGIESQSVAATRRTIEFLCPSSVYRDYVNLNENHGANADNAVSSVRTTFKSDADRQSAQQQQKASRTFSAFKKANATKQIVPISIPGGSSSSMGPSHPSYDEAVQTSISAAWINGRTDMWPLQLLDAADKQRAAVSDAAAISVPATGRQGLSSSSKAHNNGTSSSSRSQPGHASQKSQRSTSTSVAAPPLSHKPQIANPFVPSGTSGGVSHTLGSSPNQSSSASSTKQSFAPPQAPHATAASSATKAAVTATKAAPPSLQGHGSILNDREHSGQLQAKP